MQIIFCWILCMSIQQLYETKPIVFAELDKLLDNAPSLVIMQHAARISSIRKRISALNMLLKSVQRRIDNIDGIISTGATSDHSSPVQFQSQK
uniref:Biogenesis of lysosome-related organelles complex 1 subunit 7 n=1 Tax=Arundo donax TaxID=35708 RepID=A0A0A9DY34_ARUDO